MNKIANKIILIFSIFTLIFLGLNFYTNYISSHQDLKNKYALHNGEILQDQKLISPYLHWQNQQNLITDFELLIENTLEHTKSIHLSYYLKQAHIIAEGLSTKEFDPELRVLYNALYDKYYALNISLQQNNRAVAFKILSQDILPTIRQIEFKRATEIEDLYTTLSTDIERLDHAFSYHTFLERIIALITLTLLVIIAFYIHHNFASPIYKISQQIKTILKDGITDHALYQKYIERSDEVGELAKITENILHHREANAKLNNELTQLNASLEKQVRQRTKHLEKAIKEAKDASKVKSEFLATISHEIRTPMNAILGISEILQDSKLTKKQEDFVNQIKDSCHELIDIVNDLFNFSKIEAGQIDRENKRFDFQAFFVEIEKEFSPLIQKKGLEFETLIKHKDLSYITSDKNQLKQIINSFLSNALKFTEKGKITLIANLLDKNSQLQITIHDTGIGIPENKQNIIFDAFSQAEASSNRRFGGTGLGLSIAKHLVEDMGGHIKLKSTVGEGSTFTITVPLTDESASKEQTSSDTPSLQASTPKNSKQKKRTVLLVEDNLANQLVAQTLIEGFGYHVLIAQDGQKAIDIVTNTPRKIDIILMDCQMPIMDGYEATQHLINKMKNNEIPFIPIIAQTANVIEGDREKCLAIGMNDYLAKPLDKSLLKQTIAHHIAEKDNALSPRQKAEQIRADLSIFSDEFFDLSYLRELHMLLGDKFNDRLLKTFEKLTASLNNVLMNSNNQLYRHALQQAILEGQVIGLKGLSENMSKHDETIIINVILSEIRRIRGVIKE